MRSTHACFTVRQQQAGVFCAALRRRQPPLRVEKDRARVRRQHLGDDGFEPVHVGVGDVAPFFLGERFLEGSALIHRRGRDDAALVGYRFHARELPWCELHDSSENS
jgi:hypothetical protein